ncbi:efflux RND transporter permease subunit [Lonepinella koalarum]|uniref:Multidrug efflux pump n=1 Tax=Lonepinella koalarum TaxID=53417 RepID=A0A4R1KTE0_9PAST|nr:efflux RND transporter permease subunit [Lonepinella koalarum]MDH2927494.1 transporter [Lonepinella koalarum]TCK68364.1 multidrug efflux pump [Lonepinella koalarum]TFJ89621.1 efflux RND transporter permease subunit [Lonepinella koalarum]
MKNTKALFTDIFIKRPVLAISISLLIVILGLQAIFKLPVKEYPDMTVTIVTVSTTYTGASSETMKAFVTSTLEEAIAQADNIDYMKSESKAGRSTITVKMKLNTDPDLALANVSSKVNGVRRRLPDDIDDPTISVSTGSFDNIMYISFKSDTLHVSQVTDYLERNIKPLLFTVDGVAKVDIYGGIKYGFRIWLNPDKLAAYNLSASEINRALSNNNVQSAAGNSNGYYVNYKNNIETTTLDLAQLNNLVVMQDDSRIVRLKDIAYVELDKESDNYRVLANGDNATVLAIEATPTANPLTVAKNIYPVYEQIKTGIPSEISTQILYDRTLAINHSINEVIKTIFEATLIVLIVIGAFIGSFRAILIPIITIPISLIGVIALLQLFGFSINLMTLLAIILAIGLVVDDAIVVLENVDRLIKSGMDKFEAAVKGTREIALPVIAMTIALCAVYSPMALMDGITGALFKEFALTLAGAVFISGIIALTLSPMMSSTLLKAQGNTAKDQPSKLEQKIQRSLTTLNQHYESLLDSFLARPKTMLAFALLIFISIPLSFRFLSSELTPVEDKGSLVLIGQAPDYVNLDYTVASSSAFEKQLRQHIPELEFTQFIAGFRGFNQAIVITTLKSERKRSLSEIQNAMNQIGNQFAPASFTSFARPEVNTGESGLPVSLVIKSSRSYEDLDAIAENILQQARQSGNFVFINADLKFSSPKANVTINKEKAGTFGVSMSEISQVVGAYLSGSTIARVEIDGKAYDVISQVARQNRLNPQDLNKMTVVNQQGQSIPLRNFIDIELKTEPLGLNRVSQLNSVTISGVPTVSVGDATLYLEQLAQQLSADYQYEFMGESRQFKQEGNSLLITFLLAVCIIYLVLAIQFESWRDPLVIMLSVPLAISGALLSLNLLNFLGWGVSTLNVYSQVGLLTLVGLIAKHGILICEVAKEQQLHHHKSRLEAVRIAAGLRLRPILMTAFSMIAGLVPLLYASGAGASARFSIGFVIVTGLAIGTLFTIFVLPVIYCFVADKHKPLKSTHF